MTSLSSVEATRMLISLCCTIYVSLTDNRRGMAVAGRLSEDPSITVAVLEAGVNVEDLPEVGSC